MKKLLFILLLLPCLFFGQATGFVISNKASGGAIGTASATVDSYSSFNLNQTTASQTLTVPNLTNASAGKIIYINNIGSVQLTLSPGGTLPVGYGVVLRWDGVRWNICAPSSPSLYTGSGTVPSNVVATLTNDVTFKATIDGGGLIVGNSSTGYIKLRDAQAGINVVLEGHSSDDVTGWKFPTGAGSSGYYAADQFTFGQKPGLGNTLNVVARSDSDGLRVANFGAGGYHLLRDAQTGVNVAYEAHSTDDLRGWLFHSGTGSNGYYVGDVFTWGQKATLGYTFGVYGNLGIKGIGATSGTTDFVVHNSTGSSNSLVVKGDASVFVGVATNPGAFKFVVKDDATNAGAATYNVSGIRTNLWGSGGAGGYFSSYAAGVETACLSGRTDIQSFIENTKGLSIGTSATTGGFSLQLKDASGLAGLVNLNSSGYRTFMIPSGGSGAYINLFDGLIGNTVKIQISGRGGAGFHNFFNNGQTTNFGTDTDMGYTAGVTGTLGVTGLASVKAGTSTTYANIGGSVKDFYTDSNNSTTVETDLYTFTTTANTLSASGQKILLSSTGTFNDATASSQLKVYFAGILIGNTGALTVSAGGIWVITARIIRSSATTARASVNISVGGSTSQTFQTDLTVLNFTLTNIIKITGTASGATGGSNDITAKQGAIDWVPAAN